MESQVVYNEPTAAKQLNLSARTLQRMRTEGSGPEYVRLGKRRIGYTATALESWLAQRTFAHRAAELSV